MEILYKVHHGLYVNLTNKCPCACTFCLRQTMDHVGESHSLWLDHQCHYSREPMPLYVRACATTGAKSAYLYYFSVI